MIFKNPSWHWTRSDRHALADVRCIHPTPHLSLLRGRPWGRLLRAAMRPPQHPTSMAAAARGAILSGSSSRSSNSLLVRRLLSSSSSNSGSDPTSAKGGSTSKRPRPRPTPPGTFVWRDVPYHRPPAAHHQQQEEPGPADPKHHLDVYVASAPFPRPPQPVLVFVHGGLWVRASTDSSN